MALTRVAFAPEWFGLYLAPSAGGRADRVSPINVDDVQRALGADLKAALDGPMFSNCSSGSYAASTCADIRYLHLDRVAGISIASERPTDGITLGTRGDGSIAFAVRGTSIPDDARIAVQLFPPLVVDGEVVASNVGTNAESTRRAAAGLLEDGRIAFAVASGVSMVAFAQMLRSAGFVWAGYTDGGGSTSLLANGEHVGSPERRRVASFLVAREPSWGGGSGSVVAPVVLGVAGAAAALGAAYAGWRWWRSRRVA